MDDKVNQGTMQGMPQVPVQDPNVGMSDANPAVSVGQDMQSPMDNIVPEQKPTMGESVKSKNDHHETVMAALTRIEIKLESIAAKIGA